MKDQIKTLLMLNDYAEGETKQAIIDSLECIANRKPWGKLTEHLIERATAAHPIAATIEFQEIQELMESFKPTDFYSGIAVALQSIRIHGSLTTAEDILGGLGAEECREFMNYLHNEGGIDKETAEWLEEWLDLK